MTSDFELFRKQSSNRSRYQDISAEIAKYRFTEMRNEAVSFRKSLFIGQVAAAGATLLFAISMIADPSNAHEFRHLARYSALWSFVSLIFSYLVVMFFTAHSMDGSEYHIAQEATKKLADLRSETIDLRDLPQDFQGTAENLELYKVYIDEMLEQIDEDFEEFRSEILRLNETSERSLFWAKTSFVISSFFLFLAWLTPISSIFLYEYF